MASKDELEKSRAYLESNPTGVRLQLAEHALNLLGNGELENLKRFVFDATVNVRRFVSREGFASLIDASGELEPLLEASENEAYIRTTFDGGRPGFFLFHEADAVLYGRVFEAFVSVTYAALGLDMKGLVSLEKHDVAGEI